MFFGIYQQVDFLGCILIWSVILVQKLPYLLVLRSMLLLEPFCAVAMALNLQAAAEPARAQMQEWGRFPMFLTEELWRRSHAVKGKREVAWVWVSSSGSGSGSKPWKRDVFFVFFCVFLCLAFREMKKTRMCFFTGEKKRGCVFRIETENAYVSRI